MRTSFIIVMTVNCNRKQCKKKRVSVFQSSFEILSEFQSLSAEQYVGNGAEERNVKKKKASFQIYDQEEGRTFP